MKTDMTPEEIIKTLAMQPHPEGGWYKETWRDPSEPRALGTAIYFLLEAHQHSHWHKVDAVEICTGTPAHRWNFISLTGPPML